MSSGLYAPGSASGPAAVTASGYVAPTYVAKTTIDGDRVAIVSPFKAFYDGTTTASIGVTEMTNQQFFTGIDAVFEYVLTEADSVKLLNCFEVVDTNEDVDSSGANLWSIETSQDTANITVGLVNGADFKTVIETIIAGGNQVTGKQLSSAKKYFEEEMRVELNLQLKNSGLLDMLEASNVSNVVVTLDNAGGAQSMYDEITGGSAANRLKLLTQIPYSTLDSYFGEVQPSVHYLPLKGADSFTFVFDVTVDSPDSLTAVNNNLSTGGGYTSGSVIPQTHFDNEKRQIAFVAHLTRKAAPFVRDFSVDAAYANPIVLSSSSTPYEITRPTSLAASSGSIATADVNGTPMTISYAASTVDNYRAFVEAKTTLLREPYSSAELDAMDAAADAESDVIAKGVKTARAYLARADNVARLAAIAGADAIKITSQA